MHDHASLQQTFSADTPFTHWIIALEGRPEDGRTHVLNWRLYVFPAHEDGQFDYGQAVLASDHFPTMEAAWGPANELARKARADQLIARAAAEAAAN